MSYLGLNNTKTFGDKWTVKFRCLLQAQRDEIREAATTVGASNPFNLADPKTQTKLTADALIESWVDCNDLDLLAVGIACKDELNETGGLDIVDDNGRVLGTLKGASSAQGEIPYTQENAQLIYRLAYNHKFANPLNEGSSDALEGLRLRKKLARASSRPS